MRQQQQTPAEPAVACGHVTLAGALSLGTVAVFAGGRGLGVEKLLSLYDGVPRWLVLALAYVAAAGTAWGILFSRGERILRGIERASSQCSRGEAAGQQETPLPDAAAAAATADPSRVVRGARAALRLAGAHRFVPFKPAAAALFILPALGLAADGTALLAATVVLALSDIPTYTLFTVGKARDAWPWFVHEYARPDVRYPLRVKVLVGVMAVFVGVGFYGTTFFLAMKGLGRMEGTRRLSHVGLSVLSHAVAACGTAVNLSAKVKGLLEYFFARHARARAPTARVVRRGWYLAHLLVGGCVYTPAYALHTLRGLLTLAQNLGVDGAEDRWEMHVGAALWCIPVAWAENEFTVRHLLDSCKRREKTSSQLAEEAEVVVADLPTVVVVVT